MAECAFGYREGKLCYEVKFSNNERATLPVSLIHVTGEILAESTLDLKPGLRVTASLLGDPQQYQAWIVGNVTCSNSLRGLADVVKKRRNRLMTRFNLVFPWLRERYPEFLPDLSLRTFAWSYAAVVSRTWSINGMPAMIPVCDMVIPSHALPVPGCVLFAGAEGSRQAVATLWVTRRGC